MKVIPTDPPREFTVGRTGSITLRDTGSLLLDENELVTVRTEGDSPTRFDVTRTPFGYYATNSLNGTLPDNGLRPALARNTESGRLFLLLVEPSKLQAYADYLKNEGMDHLGWFDTIDPDILEPKPL